MNRWINRKSLILVAGLLLLGSGLGLGIFGAEILAHIGISLYRMLAGYLLSVVFGILLSVLIGMNRYARMAVKPLLSFFISIPTITWVPLLLIVTGISEQTIIITIILGAFFAIVFNILDGFDTVPVSMVRAAQVMGYGRMEMMFRVMIPASFNNILVGLKLGIAYSWRALVGAEMLAAASFGLGYIIFVSRKFYNVPMMLYGLAFIGILGYVMNRLIVRYIESKTLNRWGLS
jgi:NitT/TauT family transport system permease protein